MRNCDKEFLLRRADVEERTKLSRSSIYAKTNPRDRGYDAGFPVPVRIGSTSVRWVASEVDEWINSRPRAKAAGNVFQGGSK